MNELTKRQLKRWADECETSGFVDGDPVSIPRRFFELQDAEISAFITSWLSFGDAEETTKAMELVLTNMRNAPYRFIMNRDFDEFKHSEGVYLYKFLSWHDFYCVCEKLYEWYSNFDSLEDLIVREMVLNGSAGDSSAYVEALVTLFEDCYGVPQTTLSSCSRLCTFLRWMVRVDSPVDLGVWKRLNPVRLVMPLTKELHADAMELGLLTRRSIDFKAAVELTNEMRKVFGNDPLRGEFALRGYALSKVNKIKMAIPWKHL